MKMLPLVVICSLFCSITSKALVHTNDDVLRLDNRTPVKFLGSHKKCDGGYDCPDYIVLKKTEKYEVRHYPKTKWVYINSTGLDYTETAKKNFPKLFSYIFGANQQKVNIPMTKPVLTYVSVPQGPFCETSFAMHFFVPYKFQKNTPIPTSKEIKIATYEPFDVYVRSFMGPPTTENIQRNGEKLFTDLKDEHIKFDANHYLYAGYDRPTVKKDPRHHEIMVFKNHEYLML